MNILIIDDDPDFNVFFKSLLFSMYAHNVKTASNGKKGYEILMQNQIDIIFLDLNMPEMNGVEFLKLLKKEKIDIEVVILSGYIDEYLYEYKELFANRQRLTKPFDIQQLDDLLKKCFPDIIL